MAGVDLDQVRTAAERVASAHGLELVDVDFKGIGKSRVLRVFIDRADGSTATVAPQERGQVTVSGVSHQDCASVSNELSAILDVEDAVPGGEYTLEVSSPGLDRKLSQARDFERFVGSRVKLMTREPVNGNRHYEGKLERFESGRLTLELTSGKKRKPGAPLEKAPRIGIELGNVEKANLVPEI